MTSETFTQDIDNSLAPACCVQGIDGSLHILQICVGYNIINVLVLPNTEQSTLTSTSTRLQVHLWFGLIRSTSTRLQVQCTNYICDLPIN